MYDINDLVEVMKSTLDDYDDGNECFYEVVEDSSDDHVVVAWGKEAREVPYRRLLINVDTGGNGVFQFKVEFQETTDPPYPRLGVGHSTSGRATDVDDDKDAPFRHTST